MTNLDPRTPVFVGASEMVHRAGAGFTPSSADGEPDEILAPHARVISQMEIDRNLTTMSHHFAIVESAIRHHHGRSVAEHRAALGELWGSFAATAVEAPAAWDQRGLQGD